MLVVRFLSGQNASPLDCRKVFVLEKGVAVTQVLVVRFLSWQNHVVAVTQVLVVRF